MSWQSHPLPPDAHPGELKVKFGQDHSTGRATLEALRIFDFGSLGTVKAHGVWFRDDGSCWHQDWQHQPPKP